jgi:hypothetical protein
LYGIELKYFCTFVGVLSRLISLHSAVVNASRSGLFDFTAA